MEKNMGNLDKSIRMVVAVVLIVLITLKILTGVWMIVGAVVAAIFIVTSMIGFCPLYKIFGVSTCKR